MVKLDKPRMTNMLVMYGNTVIVNTTKETFWLDFIFALNVSGVLNNDVVV